MSAPRMMHPAFRTAIQHAHAPAMGGYGRGHRLARPAGWTDASALSRAMHGPIPRTALNEQRLRALADLIGFTGPIFEEKP